MLDRTMCYTSSKQSDSIIDGAINILGICFDGATSYRPGSRFAPNAIREASTQIEDYSPYLNLSLEDKKIYDLGNLRQQTLFEYHIEDYNSLFDGVDLTKTRLLTLGGDHSISYLPMSKYLKAFKDLVVLHFDAHTDLRENYLNNKFSHASVIKRVFDEFGESNKLYQCGIRSGTREEFEWMVNKNTLISLRDLKEVILSLGDAPIYITLDVDFFDPSECPGTGTPEAGGARFIEFIEIMKLLKGKNVVGADVVELSPMIDSTGNSNCFVSKIVREMLLIIRD